MRLRIFLRLGCIIVVLIIGYNSYSSYNAIRANVNISSRSLSEHGLGRIELPSHFSKLANKYDVFRSDFDLSSVTPFYWHVAKAAGTTVHDYYSKCYTMVEASEIGSFASHDSHGLKLVSMNGVKNHINVDTSIPEGVKHAKEMDLIPSRMAQIVFSPLIVDASKELFSEENQGILFAMFRHPVKRVISLFYYLQTATWEPTFNPELVNMTIDEYANSPLLEANFITRSLVDKMEGPLCIDDVMMAKKVLKEKCFVGLVEKFDDSIRYFNMAYGLKPNFDVEIEGFEESDYSDKSKRVERLEKCLTNLKGDGGSNRHKHESLSEDSETYQTIERKNGWDMLLWKTIQDEYREQEKIAMYKDLGLDINFMLKDK